MHTSLLRSRYIVMVLSIVLTVVTSAHSKPNAAPKRQSISKLGQQKGPYIPTNAEMRAVDRHFTSKQRQLKIFTPAQLARLALPSIVRLTVKDKRGQPSVQGSGVVIGPNLIVTNIHVIAKAYAVTANFENGRSQTVYGLVAEDTNSDLALLYCDTTGIKSLPLALGANPQIGDPVITVGSPEGLGGSVSTGIISGFRKMGSVDVVQTTAPTSHGSSGGALLDMHGRVLGITSFTLLDGQNLNFAYPCQYVQQLLPRNLITYLDWWELERIDESVEGANYATPALAGLAGVAVVVADVGNDAKNDGLDTNKLKTNIEAGLKKNNIVVYEDSAKTVNNPSQAWLYLSININKHSDGIYDYALEFSLYENSEVPRSSPAFTRSAAWFNFGQGTVGSSAMAQYMYGLVDGAVNNFAKDYHDQNPK